MGKYAERYNHKNVDEILDWEIWKSISLRLLKYNDRDINSVRGSEKKSQIDRDINERNLKNV